MATSKIIESIEGNFNRKENIIVLNSGRIVLSDGTMIVCGGNCEEAVIDRTGFLKNEIDILPFEAITMEHNIKAIFEEADEYSCVIDAPENLMETVSAETESGTLTIKMRGEERGRKHEIVAHIKSPRLSKIETFGVAKVEVAGSLTQSSNLELIGHEASEIEISKILSSTVMINAMQSSHINIGTLRTLTATVIKTQEVGHVNIKETALSPSYNIVAKEGSEVSMNGIDTDQILAQASHMAKVTLKGRANRANFASQHGSCIYAQELDTNVANATATEMSSINAMVDGQILERTTLSGRIVNFFRKTAASIF